MTLSMQLMQLNSNNLLTSLSLRSSPAPRWSGREESGCSLRLRDVSLPRSARFCVEPSTAGAVTGLPAASLKLKTNHDCDDAKKCAQCLLLSTNLGGRKHWLLRMESRTRERLHIVVKSGELFFQVFTVKILEKWAINSSTHCNLCTMTGALARCTSVITWSRTRRGCLDISTMCVNAQNAAISISWSSRYLRIAPNETE